jgi:hypothetical protein
MMKKEGGKMLSRLGTMNVRHSARPSFAEDDTDIRIVQVVIEFTRIGEIDTMNEKYQAEVIIESKWRDKHDIREYDPNFHWNPRLFIENAINEIKENITYRVTKENGISIITEIRRSKGMQFNIFSLAIFVIFNKIKIKKHQRSILGAT